MRKIETDLGVLAAALALIALVLTQTQQAVEYVSYMSRFGGPMYTAALPITLNTSSGPVILIGVGALFVCIGALVDARILTSSRVAPLAMLLSGVAFCAVAAFLVNEIWLTLGNAPAASAQAAQAAQLAPPSADLSLTVIFMPVTVVSGVCASVALSRHQSLRSDDIRYDNVNPGTTSRPEMAGARDDPRAKSPPRPPPSQPDLV
ncbi:MAG: hypothetical protein ACRDHE_05960 [Ktedonobacterales bacterium]